MDEQSWLAEADLTVLVRHVEKTAPVRKLRLYAVALARSVWPLVPDAVRPSVEDAERHVEGLVSDEQLQAHVHAYYAQFSAPDVPRAGAFGPVEAVCRTAALGPVPIRYISGTMWMHRVPGLVGPPGVALFHEVFGNPFRPLAFDPAWRTGTVEALAAGCYADRAWDRLPILADALEDAGCDSAALLAHLRGPGPHARGCWALDLALGKG